MGVKCSAALRGIDVGIRVDHLFNPITGGNMQESNRNGFAPPETGKP